MIFFFTSSAEPFFRHFVETTASASPTMVALSYINIHQSIIKLPRLHLLLFIVVVVQTDE